MSTTKGKPPGIKKGEDWPKSKKRIERIGKRAWGTKEIKKV